VPLLQSEIVVVNDQQITDALTLRYTKTPKSVSRFDTYRFQLSDPNIPIKEKAANDTETKVTFTDLIPGRLYNITVWTVSDGVESLPLQRQDRLCTCFFLFFIAALANLIFQILNQSLGSMLRESPTVRSHWLGTNPTTSTTRLRYILLISKLII